MEGPQAACPQGHAARPRPGKDRAKRILAPTGRLGASRLLPRATLLPSRSTCRVGALPRSARLAAPPRTNDHPRRKSRAWRGPHPATQSRSALNHNQSHRSFAILAEAARPGLRPAARVFCGAGGRPPMEGPCRVPAGQRGKAPTKQGTREADSCVGRATEAPSYLQFSGLKWQKVAPGGCNVYFPVWVSLVF